MYDALSSEPSRNMLRNTDAAGTHGIPGTLHSSGTLACGTSAWNAATAATAAGEEPRLDAAGGRRELVPQQRETERDERQGEEERQRRAPPPVAVAGVAVEHDGVGHHVEDEERADGDEVEEHVEVREQRQRRSERAEEGGGVHGGRRAGVHLGQPRGHHARPSDHEHVPGLAQHRHHQRRQDAHARAGADHLGHPLHPVFPLERPREGRVRVDLVQQ
jgi:hypothetical protein